ncbi:MAG: cadherin-like beta sandwich domain-containing protein [bacterium]
MSSLVTKLFLLPIMAILALAGCVSNSDSAGSPKLKAIDLSAGALEPAFAPDTTSYVVHLDQGIDKIQVAPIQSHYLASTTIEGTRIANGQYSAPIALSLGNNLVELEVTAQDGVVKRTYFLNIIRGEGDPAPSGTPGDDSNNGGSGGSGDNNDGNGGDSGDNGDGNQGGSDGDNGGDTPPPTDDGSLPAPSGSRNAPGSNFLYQAYYLKAPAPAKEAKFGSKVAVFGNTIVVGAPKEDSAKGAVYVFAEEGGNLNAPVRLQPGDLKQEDRFGNGLAIDGNTLVIGATGKDQGANNAGAVYTYRYQNGSWQQVDTLLPSEPGKKHRFGTTLSLSGSTLAVSTLRNAADNNDGGGVYIYTRNGDGWKLQDYIHPDFIGSHDTYSHNIDLEGSTLAIGSFSPDQQCQVSNGDPGSVEIYTRNGNQWQFSDIVLAPSGNASDRFGYSVDLDNGKLAVGAMCEDGEGNGETQRGAAYVFQQQGNSWVHQQTVRASNGSSHSLFGDEVKLRGNTLVVSASYDSSTGLSAAGAIYVYRNNGGTWQETNILRASNLGKNDRFGQAMAVGGEKIVVGAPDEDGGDPNDETNNSRSHAGAVYVFK